MTPEEKARVKIDQMFEDAGWQVVDRDFYSPSITAAAIREGLLNGNREADYFLFRMQNIEQIEYQYIG